jgi:hypothetical protein
MLFRPKLRIFNNRFETPNFNIQYERPSCHSHGFAKSDFQKGASNERTLRRLKKSTIRDAIVPSVVKTKNIRFQETLLDLFASCPVPFSLVESLKFQRLFEIYNINLPIKNCHSLSTKLKEPGFEIEQKVKELLSSDECISLHLQLDLWQSPSDRGHYINLIG